MIEFNKKKQKLTSAELERKRNGAFTATATATSTPFRIRELTLHFPFEKEAVRSSACVRGRDRETERGGTPFLHIFKTLQSYIIINFIKIFKEKKLHTNNTQIHTHFQTRRRRELEQEKEACKR